MPESFYWVDWGRRGGDQTCAVKYSFVDGVLRFEEISFDEMYERPAIDARLVPGTNPPRYETT